MWFFYALSWASLVLQVAFVSVSIAAGLFYLSELVEEYTSTAAVVIRWMILCVLATFVCLLLFEHVDTAMCALGVCAQLCHLALVARFPAISLTSASFVAAAVLTVVNHVVAFRFFSRNYYDFNEIVAYFTVCLWLVPVALSVSLSADDNVLPVTQTVAAYRGGGVRQAGDDGDMPLLFATGDSGGDVVTSYLGARRKKGAALLKSAMQACRRYVAPEQSKRFM